MVPVAGEENTAGVARRREGKMSRTGRGRTTVVGEEGREDGIWVRAMELSSRVSFLFMTLARRPEEGSEEAWNAWEGWRCGWLGSEGKEVPV